MTDITITLKFPLPKMDDAVLKLIPNGSEEFLKAELQRHHIESVESNMFMKFGNDGPAVWLPDKRKILIDVDYPSDKLIEGIGRVLPVCLRMGKAEAWLFAILHECAHADGLGSDSTSELECNLHARKRLLEWYRQRDMLQWAG